QLVESVGGGPVGPRLSEQAPGIARRVDLLMIELCPPRADERAERRRHRHELDFVPDLLGVVVERGLNAVDAAIADAELGVVIFDRAGPEADDVDRRTLRPELAFTAVSDLLQRDARVGARAVQSGNMVERAEAGDGGADIAAVEEV